MKPLSPMTLTIAYAADLAFGDPESVPHPVRSIGRLIAFSLRHARPGSSKRRDALNGAALTVFAITAAYAGGSLSRLNRATEAVLAWTTMATGSLIEEASAVIYANDVQTSRALIARIVGRDTASLDSSEIARAVIETLAESLCDGVVAPLLYLAVGGVPLAMAYKAISTLDSMIGHIEHPYTHFGRLAARLDDGANFIPSRLTALLIVAAASIDGKHRQAFRTWRADGRKHPSPNAGQSEAAMAGALGVRLGGPNYYNGIASPKPLLGAPFPASSFAAVKTAIRLTRTASLLAFFCALAYTLRRRRL